MPVDSVQLAELRHAASLKDYATACRRDYDATMRHSPEIHWPVLDVVTQGPILKSEDIVVMSDGRCYSKHTILRYTQRGAVDDETGLSFLPLTRSPLQDDDYRQLGREPPTSEEATARRDLQRATTIPFQHDGSKYEVRLYSHDDELHDESISNPRSPLYVKLYRISWPDKEIGQAYIETRKGGKEAYLDGVRIADEDRGKRLCTPW